MCLVCLCFVGGGGFVLVWYSFYISVQRQSSELVWTEFRGARLGDAEEGLDHYGFVKAQC